MPRKQINEKYEIDLSPMAYNSLVSAIPDNWKYVLRQQRIIDGAVSSREEIFLNCNNNEKPFRTTQNRDIYKSFQNTTNIIPKCQTHWENVLSISNADWKYYFTIPKVDRESKVQSFQYKIIHRIFSCNKYVSKFNKEVSNICSYCQSIDDICHYFFGCNKTRNFWDELVTWLNKHTDIVDVRLTCTEVILGKLGTEPNVDLWNIVILQGKWYIFKKKMHKSELSITEFIHKLKERIQMEKQIYTAKQKVAAFNVKYKPFVTWLE